MSRRLPLFALLALVLGGGLLLLWQAVSGPGSAGPPVVHPEETPGAETPEAGSEALTAGPGTGERRGGLTEGFDLAGAVYVEGRVRFPAGAPADPTLRIEAHPFSRNALATLSPIPGSSLRRVERLNGPPLADAWVAADGRFRVPLPAGTEAAALRLDGRYLFLERPVATALGEPVVIEPALGACVAVTLRAEEDAIGLAGTTVHLSGGRGRKRTERSAAVEDEPRLEFRGLRADEDFLVRVESRDLAPAGVLVEDPPAGVTTELELVVGRGAAVSGHVRDNLGRPVAGARVAQRVTRAGLQAAPRVDVTESDGAFELLALPPGALTLEVSAQGFQPAARDLGELAPRERRTQVALVLAPGLEIEGRVEWPDGSPSAATAIDVADEGARTVQHSVVTAADGTFAVGGLGAGPYRLQARALKADADGGAAVAWTARAEGVRPGGAPLLLVLQPPLTLRGRVETVGGEALSEFIVRATSVQAALGRSNVVRRFGGGAGPAPRDGAFELDGLQPGPWRVEAEAPGYVLVGDAPTVTLPGPRAEVVLRLGRRSALRGLVLDPNGEPAPGAEVRRLTGAGGVRRVTAEVPTREDGTFLLADAGPGTVTLLAAHPNWADSAELTLELGEGEVREDVRLVLQRGGHLTGELLDERGEPQPGRQVVAMAGGFQGAPERQTTTDAEGRFELRHLVPGSTQVLAVPETGAAQPRYAGDETAAEARAISSMEMATVEVVAGETVHVVLGGRAATAVEITGRILQRGAPLARALVMCVREGQGLLESLKSTVTDDDGRYRVTVDAPGEHVFVVRTEANPQGVEFYATVPEVEVHVLDLELPGGVLAGSVYGPEGEPLPGVSVLLSSARAGMDIGRLDGPTTARTDGEGHYEFRELRAGVYSLRTAGAAEGATGALGWRVIDDVQLGEDAVRSDLDFHLAAGGRIEGEVVDAEGSPVGGASVFVRDADGRLLHRFSNVSTDGLGHFRYDGVPPGEVSVFARGPGALVAGETKANVTAAKPTPVRLTARAGTRLLVQLRDGDGRPVRGELSVRDDAGGEHAGLASHEATRGTFAEGYSSSDHRVGPLPPGRYRLRAVAPDGRAATAEVTLAGEPQVARELELE